MPNPLGKYGDMLVKGLVSQAAPAIAQGVLVELLRKRKINVKLASEWVLSNRILWNDLEPREQESLRRLAGKVGDMGWMDFDWAIGAMRGEFPAVASLFLGWTKGRNWLTRQVEIVKSEIRG